MISVQNRPEEMLRIQQVHLRQIMTFLRTATTRRFCQLWATLPSKAVFREFKLGFYAFGGCQGPKTKSFRGYQNILNRKIAITASIASENPIFLPSL